MTKLFSGYFISSAALASILVISSNAETFLRHPPNTFLKCHKRQSKPPKFLSQACLYREDTTVWEHLISYEPKYPLWTDGVQKKRWAYIPGKIDSHDSNNWIFPIGTMFWKEFSLNGLRLETRVIRKTASQKWSFASYKWNENQTDAEISPGDKNILGTQHDIPSKSECIMCHKGSKDRILGFDQVQLGGSQLESLQKYFSTGIIVNYEIPGSPLTQKVFGYFHGNCAHCHNPSHSFSQPGWWLGLWFKVNVNQLSDKLQPTWVTSVNVESLYDTKSIWKYRVSGRAYQNSAVYARMETVNPIFRMPPLGTKLPDHYSLDLVQRWIDSIDPDEKPLKSFWRRFQEWIESLTKGGRELSEK